MREATASGTTETEAARVGTGAWVFSVGFVKFPDPVDVAVSVGNEPDTGLSITNKWT